ncbi:MAG: hypothetical protein U0527_09425 [Candidatus Eisenbacteria bacterium]
MQWIQRPRALPLALFVFFVLAGFSGTGIAGDQPRPRAVLAFSASSARPASGEERELSGGSRSLYFITEAGLGFQSGSHGEPAYDPRVPHSEWGHAVSFGYSLAQYGLLARVTRNWAIGPTARVVFSEQENRLAIEPRLRRWVSDRVSIDLSAGPVIMTEDEGNARLPHLSSSLSANFDDRVSLGLSLERLRYRRSADETRVGAVMRVGRLPGVIGTALIAAFNVLETYERSRPFH